MRSAPSATSKARALYLVLGAEGKRERIVSITVVCATAYATCSASPRRHRLIAYRHIASRRLLSASIPERARPGLPGAGAALASAATPTQVVSRILNYDPPR